jgi:phage shock protein C
MERRLYRNKQTKLIGGVCSGLAEYFDIDPVLVRLLFVIFAFHPGLGVPAYIIMWIVVPVKKPDVVPAAAFDGAQSAPVSPATVSAGLSPETKSKRASIAGIVLIALGAIFLADNLIPAFCFGDLWPLIFIVLGGGLLWNSLSHKTSQETII